jgi:phosphocarrier protein HPr
VVEAKAIVENAHGIHARPAAQLVETSAKFSSAITLVNDAMEADAKSIMNIMMLSAVHGTEVTIRCNGDDENEALSSVLALFEDRFGQES